MDVFKFAAQIDDRSSTQGAAFQRADVRGSPTAVAVGSSSFAELTIFISRV